MELGALVCTARAPRCATCPLRDGCAWRLAGSPAYGGPHAEPGHNGDTREWGPAFERPAWGTEECLGLGGNAIVVGLVTV